MIRLDAQIPPEAFADPAVPSVVRALEEAIDLARRGVIRGVAILGAGEGPSSHPLWVMTPTEYAPDLAEGVIPLLEALGCEEDDDG